MNTVVHENYQEIKSGAPGFAGASLAAASAVSLLSPPAAGNTFQLFISDIVVGVGVWMWSIDDGGAHDLQGILFRWATSRPSQLR